MPVSSGWNRRESSASIRSAARSWTIFSLVSWIQYFPLPAAHVVAGPPQKERDEARETWGRVGVWACGVTSLDLGFASRVHSQARSYVDTPPRPHAPTPPRPTRPHAHTPTRPHAHTPTRPHAHTPTRPHAPTRPRRNVRWRCFLRDRAEGTKVSRDRDYNVQYSGRNMK